MIEAIKKSIKQVSAFILGFLFIACQNPNSHNNQSTERNKTKTIDEKLFVTLGNDEQYVELSGRSDELPVLLFLHGGPGWPQTPQLRYFNADLSKELILVSWDQAGCGKSLMHNPNPEKLSPESLVNDAHELTQWLKNKFNKRKIFLAGFSYGSVIGLQLAEKYPNDYHAYIGIDQIIDLDKSWEKSIKWLKKQAKAKNDSTTLKQLSLIEKKDQAFCETTLDCFMAKYQLLLKYEGIVFDSNISKEIEKVEKMYADYKDYNWFDAFNYTAERMDGAAFKTNLSHIKNVNVPIYFMAGRHDWNLPGSVAEDHLREMIAPEKKFIWFEKSGHEIPSEESEKFNQTIIDIVKKIVD